MVEACVIRAGATCREALTCATAMLRRVAHDEAAADARRLLLFALGIAALDLVAAPGRRLTADEAATYSALLEDRCRGKPVSRITGWRGFYGRKFAVSDATLDPRPDSETLVDTALARMRALVPPDGAGLDILDIGTGSGCLLLTLLAHWPAAVGTGVDPSSEALHTAAHNAQRLGLTSRCTWVNGRGFANLGRRFPLIISNPPYIPTATIDSLAPEVRDHDPRLALDGGVDGLDVYRVIAAGLRWHTTPGWTILEVGHDQAASVDGLVAGAFPPGHLGQRHVIRDLAGLDRCLAVEVLV